jgi:hypothetical protein
MSLKDITQATKLHKMTLYEHLNKLVTAGFIKRIEREGHKWVYYKLTWKGSSLLHPENTRIVVMFSITFISLVLGLISFITFILQKPVNNIFYDVNRVWSGPLISDGKEETEVLSVVSTSPFFLYIAVVCIIVFTSLLVLSIWRYKNNKPQKL